MSTTTDWIHLMRDLRRAGFVLEPRKGHVKVRSRRGKYLMTLPGSPSDQRGIRNARMDLRRFAGYECR